MVETISRSEVSKHNTAEDAWVIVDDRVLDVTKFANLHPGGAGILLDYAGQDATEAFYGLHRQSVIDKFGPRLLVGRLPSSEAKIVTEDGGLSAWGKISPVPYAEHFELRDWHNPFYSESHKKWRKYVREFYDREVREIAEASEQSNSPPTTELLQKISKAGLLHTQLGVGEHLKMLPIPPEAGVTAETFDYFHSCVLKEEASRLQCPGFVDGLYSGMTISVPAMMHFGNEKIRNEFVPKILRGEKCSVLAITEATHGSDVSGIRTTAKLSPDGSHYIVNGTKKWITNSHHDFCEYFVTAVRTGGPGAGGVSMLLIERTEGLETKLIKTNYSSAAGTGYVTFDNVKVPAGNLMGKENQGFKQIMANFNLERLNIAVGVNAGTRFIIEECLKWANQRQVFGKALIQQPTIREKLGRMIADVESVQAYQDLIVYQMQNMVFAEQNKNLGGPIALLKAQSTIVASRVSQEACQIFGGRAVTTGGMGAKVNAFAKAQAMPKIYGGSEEVMLDLGVRQALKSFPRDAKL